MNTSSLLKAQRVERLVLRDGGVRRVDLREAVAVRDVVLVAPLLQLHLPPAVENATLAGVRCGPGAAPCRLRRLLLQNVTTREVTSWVQRCDGLESLQVDRSTLGELPATSGALRALRELIVRRSGLRRVAPDSLASAEQLRRLDLSFNKLVSLPKDMFARSSRLLALDISHNALSAASLAALAPLSTLQSLDVSYNPLGDLCPARNLSGPEPSFYVPNVMSALWQCRSLKTLRLERVRATRLCADWRRLLTALTDLDLRHNQLSLIEYEDLLWERASVTHVDLRGNPVRSIRYRRPDYERYANVTPGTPVVPMTTLVIDSLLECDCGVYWFACTLQDGGARGAAAVEGARCGEGGVSLADVPLEALVCEVGAPACPTVCRCAVSGAGASLGCGNASLAAPPARRDMSTLGPVRSLSLQHNRIERIRADDIPPEVTMLDLSYNRLQHVESTLWGSGARSVLLAGNPLQCSCELVDELLQHREVLLDWEEVRCADGTRPLRCLLHPGPPLMPTIAGAVLVLGVLAAILVLYYGRPGFAYRIKMCLVDRGVCGWRRGGVEIAADAEVTYDAFVSFSHHDHEYASALAAALEAPPHRLRLCMHHRDWLPGELITNQIVRSIRRSRRTVVLLSDWFAASSWARAEFRSAFTHALSSPSARPLVVLLPSLSLDRERLVQNLDPELALFVAKNTYLEWSDPAFWDKLPRALRPS
ncbi:protein toll-like isoform X2 [Leptidea sinapis]|uniref:protein toll-like isoform X2 n=1 Tax=Leptidea sinapis TaxID=189913 RepID=UPI0021C3773B|nr:protein toll-like isoform X2 [Leptidea sinapis]